MGTRRWRRLLLLSGRPSGAAGDGRIPAAVISSHEASRLNYSIGKGKQLSAKAGGKGTPPHTSHACSQPCPASRANARPAEIDEALQAAAAAALRARGQSRLAACKLALPAALYPARLSRSRRGGSRSSRVCETGSVGVTLAPRLAACLPSLPGRRSLIPASKGCKSPCFTPLFCAWRGGGNRGFPSSSDPAWQSASSTSGAGEGRGISCKWGLVGWLVPLSTSARQTAKGLLLFLLPLIQA